MKKKILFVSETVTMAHLIRPLAIAASLNLNEYEVHFAATRVPEFLLQEIFNYKLHEIKGGVSEKTFITAISNGKHPYTEEILKAYVEEDRRLLRSIKPDVVIGDMRLTLKISAKLENIPYINISNSTWDSSAVLPTIVPDIPVVKTFGVTVAEIVYPLIRTKILNDLAEPFNKVAKHYGVPAYGSYYDVLTSGEFTVYGDLESLVEIKNKKPNKITIGALLFSMNSDNLPALDLKKKTKPRVILTLGSSGPSHQLQKMIDSLSELDIELVVSTCGKPVVKPISGNVILMDYLPLDKIMADADLIIFNGGSGSGYLGLSHGVPLLCVPSNIDQHQFSYAMKQKGVAQILRSDKFSALKIKMMAEEMLSNRSFKIAAQIVQQEIRMEAPLEKFNQLIKAIIEVPASNSSNTGANIEKTHMSLKGNGPESLKGNGFEPLKFEGPMFSRLAYFKQLNLKQKTLMAVQYYILDSLFEGHNDYQFRIPGFTKAFATSQSHLETAKTLVVSSLNPPEQVLKMHNLN